MFKNLLASEFNFATFNPSKRKKNIYNSSNFRYNFIKKQKYFRNIFFSRISK